MNLRNTISRALASTLLPMHRKRLAKGRPCSLPIEWWQRIPDGVMAWLRYRLLGPGAELAWKEIQSHEYLMPLRAHESNSWSISPAAMLTLWHTLLETSPRRIVEFGSGATTEIFSRYAATMAERGIEVSILSIEHDIEWYDTTVANLNTADESSPVLLVHAPLTEQRLLDRNLTAYTIEPKQLSEAAGSTGFDFCFIDGPPGIVGRAGCLPLIASSLGNNAMVLLDDAARPKEQAILDEWMALYSQQIKKMRMLLIDNHGIAVFHWKKCVHVKG